jgi:alkylresorcinol/alkylpyrone synthase
LARLMSVATSVPQHVLEQSAVLDAARQIFSERYSAFARMEPVFTTAGINQRYAIKPLSWYTQARGWPDRTEAYIAGATDLFISAARKALAAAGCEACDVDAIVTVSSTGIATPSVEAYAHAQMGFRNNVKRTPIFGLGCAGGVTGLATAARLADAAPGSIVLLVAVELCTLSCRLDQLTKANIVATALFGDGAAACVLSSSGGIASIDASAEMLWPATLDIMGWAVDSQGLGVIFDRSIPSFASENLALALDQLLDEMRVSKRDVDRFICHPGGAKVISAIEESLNLPEGALDHERTVLADYGNMSAPTALFVLDQAIRAGLPQQSILMALGPGFTLSALSLKRAP